MIPPVVSAARSDRLGDIESRNGCDGGVDIEVPQAGRSRAGFFQVEVTRDRSGRRISG
jgi:hypothetical protein